MLRAHRSPYTGSWFPADSCELRDLAGRLFSQSAARTGKALLPRPVAFLVPHAGLIYSGTVAASAYRTIREHRPARVVILGFSHSRFLHGVAIPDVEAYQTPLGEIEVDRDAARELAGDSVFHPVSEAAVCDHSLEIQLPLLAEALPGVRVVPLYVGDLDGVRRREAAQVLATLIAPDTVLVASSDLTHYGRPFHYVPFPSDRRVADRLRDLDTGVLEAAGSLDPEMFLHELDETGATVCGRGPISLLLETLAQVRTTEIFQQTLDYQTSGEITGDYSTSVSYGCTGYFPAESFWLGEEDQQLLLQSARRTLHNALTTGDRRSVPPEPMSARLERPSGVFVSIHRHGQLRGCVGCHTAARPFHLAVPALALDAALGDPRFKPLGPDELDFDLEISVLTPMKRVARPEQVRAGDHGVYVEAGLRRGLLLPQVASERRWNRETFLAALAEKAGVPQSVFSKPGTRLSVFRAQVFGSNRH